MPPPELTTRPSYAAAFRCIGASCEDTCCRSWSIPLDRQTFARYQQFAPGPLRSLVGEYVSIGPAGSAPGAYAEIHQTASGACPFYSAERLCAIQEEHGAALLSASCSIYPRALNLVEGTLEGSLSLSCPEAARSILLIPDSTRIAADLLSGEFRTDNVSLLGGSSLGASYKPTGWFQSIRTGIVELVGDRSYSVVERVLILGLVCEELDQITSDEPARDTVPQALRDPAGRIQEIRALPGDPAVRLRAVFALTDQAIRTQTCGPRFLDTFWSLVEGIGAPASGDCAAAADDLERFLTAERLWLQPFLERWPFLLENYLLNYVFQHLFPFGREGSAAFVSRSIFDEYLLLATQFAWVVGLLVGSAAQAREGFDERDAVRVIQSFTRTVEHEPELLSLTLTYVREQGLGSVAGIAMLLRSAIVSPPQTM